MQITQVAQKNIRKFDLGNFMLIDFPWKVLDTFKEDKTVSPM